MRAEGLLFDLVNAAVGDMFQFQYRTAKYAIVLGNNKLTVLMGFGFFKVVNLAVFHVSRILEFITLEGVGSILEH
jgi:hypothetical protein